MSEQGWKEFLAADGISEWVVLHGGATAVFRVASITDGARLVSACSELPDFHGEGIVVTLTDDTATVRLTRDIWLLEGRHVNLARRVSEVARQHGAVADRAAVQEVQVAIAAKRDAACIDFWRAVLGYRAAADDNAVDPLGHGSAVWMQELAETKALRHAMHIDVSVAREQLQARLESALAAGGRIVDESHAPAHWTLADPAGNRVCICAWPDGSGLTNAEVAMPPVSGESEGLEVGSA